MNVFEVAARAEKAAGEFMEIHGDLINNTPKDEMLAILNGWQVAIACIYRANEVEKELVTAIITAATDEAYSL